MSEKEFITESLLRKKPGSVRVSTIDSPPLTPGDLFFDRLAEAIVRRIEQRLNDLPRLLDIEEAARYLGLTVHALRHKAGSEIPVVRIDSKLRFDRHDLDRYIDRAKREGL